MAAVSSGQRYELTQFLHDSMQGVRGSNPRTSTNRAWKSKAVSSFNLSRDSRNLATSATASATNHSAASLMLAQGVKLQVVSEVLGHSSIRMTADVYGHILDPDRASAAAAMNATLWGKFDLIE
jgi:integrase